MIWGAYPQRLLQTRFGQSAHCGLRTVWPEDTQLLGAVAEAADEVIRDAQANAVRFWKRAKDQERTIRNARKLDT